MAPLLWMPVRLMPGYFHAKPRHRDLDGADPHERRYKELPIAEKEFNKWIGATVSSGLVLKQAATSALVADRESDIR